MKRLVCCLFVLSLLFTPAVSVPAGAETAYTAEIEFLKNLGTLPEDYFEESYLYLTKAEFLSFVMKTIYPQMDFSSAGEEPFFDVNSEHAYCGVIGAAKKLNIINGDGRNYFYPDNDITLEQAYTVLINALGYTRYALAKGGYPTGYLTAAMETGMTKGVSVPVDESLAGDTAAKIICNALKADLVVVESIGDGGISLRIEKGKTVMGSLLGIREFKGIVTANSVTALSGEITGAADQAVLTDEKTGESITVASSTAGSYLGYRLNVFVRENEDGSNELLSYQILSKTEKILCDDIIQINNSYIEYEQTQGKERKLSLASPPSVLFNGVCMTVYEQSLLLPEDGYITCIDQNDDGRYDVLSVMSFNYRNGSYDSFARNVVAAAVDETGLYIKDLFDNGSDLDLNSDEYLFYFTADSEIQGLDEIYEFDVISVAECPVKADGKTLYYLSGSKNRMEGPFYRLNENEIAAGDAETEVSSSILEVKPNYFASLKLEEVTAVRLDSLGKAAYFETEAGQAVRNYAFLGGYQHETGLDESVRVRLFTMNGKLEEFRLADNVYLDNSQQKTDPVTALQSLQENGDNLLAYECNQQNEIKRIYLCYPATGDFTEDSSKLVLNYTMTKSQKAYSTLSGIGITDTYFFQVFKRQSDNSILENYSTCKYNGFVKSTNYTGVRFYDVGINGIAKVALKLGVLKDGEITSGTLSDSRSTAAVFKELVQAVDSDGEILDKIYFYQKGVLQSAFLRDGMADAAAAGLSYDIRKLQPGDIFVYEKDMTGKIQVYSTMYVDSMQREKQGILHTNTQEYYATHLYLKGNLCYKGSDAVTVSFMEGEQLVRYPMQPNTALIVYRINRETGKINIVPLSQIQTGSEQGTDVVIWADREVIQEMFVYE